MDDKFLKIIFFVLIILGSVFEVVGDVFFKKWSIESKNILLGIGLLAYFTGSIFWAFSLKYEILSKAISVCIIVNLLIAILVGVIFFRENLIVKTILLALRLYFREMK